MLFKHHVTLTILLLFGLVIQGQEVSFWQYSSQRAECLSTDQQRNIIEQLKLVHRETRALQEYGGGSRSTSLAFPLKYADDLEDPGDFAYSNFVDHDSVYSVLNDLNVLDYDCGNRSYDYELGNHQGTDIFAWPFLWKRMAKNEVEVIAAADGMIIDVSDGNYDRHCEFCLSCEWNAIYLQHPDGIVTWYGHLKSGSLTTKRTGEIVEKGEFLGVVGSSGVSTGPHLHFHVWESNDYINIIDPFKGECNQSVGAVSWDDQDSYYSPSVSYLTTGQRPPGPRECGKVQKPYVSQYFEAGDNIYISAYYKDIIEDSEASFTIYDPEGVIYDEWTLPFSDVILAGFGVHKRNINKILY